MVSENVRVRQRSEAKGDKGQLWWKCHWARAGVLHTKLSPEQQGHLGWVQVEACPCSASTAFLFLCQPSCSGEEAPKLSCHSNSL